MQTLTEEGRRIVEAVAKRHGVSSDAVYQLMMAIAAGHGRQAQFNHPELGGMGQWAQGGMTMIGDMFDQPLKARVEALCNELAGFIQGQPPGESPASQNPEPAKRNRLFISAAAPVVWPAELGTPSASGSQNDMHYAVFPQTRRLAIANNGRIAIYDTADHVIGGLAQQQGPGQSLSVTSQHGLVPLSDLKVVRTGMSQAARRARVKATVNRSKPVVAPAPQETPPDPAPAPASQTPAPQTHATPPALSIAVPAVPMPPSTPAPEPAAKPEPIPATSDEDIFSRIERLADLRKKDIITAEEFAAKKTELLARL